MNNILVTRANEQWGNEMRRLVENGLKNRYVFAGVAESDITNLEAVRKSVSDNHISILNQLCCLYERG